MIKKKILIHTIVFSPDGVSTAYLYNDIALRFKNEGYEVVVLTTTPHYNILRSEVVKQPLSRRMLGLYYESDFNGIRVLHIPQKKFKNSFLRILGFVYWHFLSFFLGLAQKNIQLILSPSPPLTIGIVNLAIAKLKGAKVIYNVQEIYPDFLINQGKLKSRLVISLLKSMERFVYQRSDAVVTIDEIFYRTIEDRFEDKNKLRIIPNFVDTDLYKPDLSKQSLLDPLIFSPDNDCLKVMYAGNIGHAQSWQPLIEVAKGLLGRNVEFWIIGEGVMKSYLEQQIALLGLDNVHLVPYQKRDLMPTLISYADLHFLFMSPEMEGQGFPSKVYTIMACAKPLLVISGKDTPICNFLKSLDSAYLIYEKQLKRQSESVIRILENLLIDKSKLSVMGESGYKHTINTYSSHIVTKQYVDLVNQTIDIK